jgi:hypothetical protein
VTRFAGTKGTSNTLLREAEIDLARRGVLGSPQATRSQERELRAGIAGAEHDARGHADDAQAGTRVRSSPSSASSDRAEARVRDRPR